MGMNVSTGTLTLALVIGLILGSTASLCGLHRLSPTNDLSPAHAHDPSHPHSHAHSHRQPVSPGQGAAPSSDISGDDVCHHHQSRVAMLTSVELPSYAPCTGMTGTQDPLLHKRNMGIERPDVLRPPLFRAPPDRPPALLADQI